MNGLYGSDIDQVIAWLSTFPEGCQVYAHQAPVYQAQAWVWVYNPYTETHTRYPGDA